MLPREYQQLEYITASGKQFINTNYKPSLYTRIKTDTLATAATTGNEMWVLGVEWSLTGFILITKNDNEYIWHFSKAQSIETTMDERHKIEAYQCDVYLDGEQIHSGTASPTRLTKPIYLFGNATTPSGYTSNFIGNFYGCQIWEQESLVRNFVPCYRRSDNVTGLYDLVNDVFYTNLGTGSFTNGPEIGNTTNLTISEYLQQLTTDKTTLVANLTTKGVEANDSETFTDLVPKVLNIQGGGETEDLTTELNTYNAELTTQENTIDDIVLLLQAKGIVSPPTPDDYIQDGLIALFDGTDSVNENGEWLSRVGTDKIYSTSADVGTSATNLIPHSSDSYLNNCNYTLVSTGNYLKKGYTIELVGKVQQPGTSGDLTNTTTIAWLLTMNMQSTPGIGVQGTHGTIIFENMNKTATKWTGLLNKRFGASLRLDNVPNRDDAQTADVVFSDTTCSWSGSVNGEPFEQAFELTQDWTYKKACTPVLSYYDYESRWRVNGEICCLRVYNRPLTDEEVAYNHEIDKVRFKLEQ